MTIAEVLRQAARLVGVSDSPRLDTELLLTAASGLDRTYFYTWPERALTPQVTASFEAMLARRMTGEPVAHITGQREFWSLPLMVDNTTLIPRPDTEVLVEVALTSLHAFNISAPRILDLGTGTGAIALALASEIPSADVTAVDQSAQAVLLAKRNAKALGKNITVQRGGWLDDTWLAHVKSQPPFDCIVSNPPYIDEADPHLAQGDVRFEPLSALVAGRQGYCDLFTIIDLAHHLLKTGGALWLEHGYQQAVKVREYLTLTGFAQVATHNDYGGNPRVTGGYRL
ncbi:peptide chain release factor N(5)-glutamine methyltransferase [Marinagarivorans algicola]|uniref:peptide chain release factor N(5)-glutamine methyltransferase n=1 Tax=Marinagarivorans algicola TaxID=1513270 RepID=UPI0006B9F692|nr:peptide chain release factor N(5)-glutamine methyltransferase [Marinagarivorans algicola]